MEPGAFSISLAVKDADIRELQRQFKGQGIQFVQQADGSTTGTAL